MPLPARPVLLPAILAVTLWARAALACSVCACGDPLVAATDASSTPGEARAAVESEWLTATAGTEESPAIRERVEQGTLRVLGVYSPGPGLNVVLQVPLEWKRSTVLGGPSSDAVRQTGLGDVDVGARWFLLERSDFLAMRRETVALSFGTSLPTGSNGARGPDGVRLDEHAQLGTGAFGPYAGLQVRVDGQRWSAFASVTGRYRTENGAAYRYGSALGWTAQVQRSLLPRLAVGLGLDGRQAGADRSLGGAVLNTGGLVLAAAPAVYVGLTERLWLTVRAQVPIATRLYGVQDVGPVYSAGLQVRVF